MTLVPGTSGCFGMTLVPGTSVKSNEERRLEYMTLAMHDMEIREEAREEGRIEGREEGKENATVTGLRTVMKKMKLSAEKAMTLVPGTSVM